MSEKFVDIEKVFNANNVFEIDPEENVMRGGKFLSVIDEIRQEIISTISDEVDNLLDNESINLSKLDEPSNNSITYIIKTLSAEKGQLVWKNEKIRFRLSIEASVDQESTEFQSPLDDIRQSIQSENQ